MLNDMRMLMRPAPCKQKYYDLLSQLQCRVV